MTTIKIAVWIFILLIGALTLYLGILNRSSEKISTNLPTALAVSAVGTLLTLLFSLQGEVRSSTFPVEYVVVSETMTPYDCDFLPEMGSYADPGEGSGGGSADLVLTQFAEEKCPVPRGGSSDEIMKTYHRVLLRQMLDTLRSTYQISWDTEPRRFALPSDGGGGETGSVFRAARPGEKISNATMIRTLGAPVAGSSSYEFLNVPPRTKVSGSITVSLSTIEFTNEFVHVQITVATRGLGHELGRLQPLCRVQSDQARRYGRPRYEVALSAQFNALRAGNPSMPLYHRWVDVMFEELQRFDARSRWDKLANDYLLLYANRPNPPFEEPTRRTPQK